MDPRVATVSQQIAKSGLQPVYLVCGEDELAVKEAARVVEKAALGSSPTDFDVDRFELGAAEPERILGALGTRPMWGERRLVVVRCPKGLDKDGSDLLLPAVKEAVPFSTLLVVAGKVDLRLGFVGAVKKAGGLFAMSPPTAREVPAMLVDRAASDGFRLERDAAALLVETVGSDLLALQTTLTKLYAYVGERTTIRREDVEVSVERTREEVIWDLTEAVGQRNLTLALVTLGGMLDHGESPVGAVAMIARHFRDLWRIRGLLASGVSEGGLGDAAKMHPFRAKKLAVQARQFSEPQLERAMERLFVTDRALKSSKLADKLIVERLVFELCAASR
jgi:DNA polymerase-3 subunit delta